MGSIKRSRRLPRRVREERVARSKRYHLRQTRAAELRLRTSMTAAMILDRSTSGRSLRVVPKVAAMLPPDANCQIKISFLCFLLSITILFFPSIFFLVFIFILFFFLFISIK